MTNAPFIFNPPDWNAFYEALGWRKKQMHFIGEEAERLGRPAPHPRLLRWALALLSTPKMRETFNRMNGYALLEPSESGSEFAAKPNLK
jgi:hypothetical protein